MNDTAVTPTRPRGRRLLRWSTGVLAATVLAACANAPAADSPPEPAPPKPPAAAPAEADRSSFGSYLAGRHAYSTRDFGSAAEYLRRALADDPDNLNLLNRTISLMVADGRMTEAMALSEQMADIDPDERVAQLMLGLRDARNGDMDAARQRFAAVRREGVYAFLMPLLDGWLTLATTDIDAALAALGPLADREAYLPFYALHVGHLQALAGNNAEAEASLRRAIVASRGSLRTVAALGRFLEATGQPDKARTVYEEYRAQNPGSVWVERVVEALGTAPPPPLLVSSATDGFAEALFSAASALPQQDGGDASLIYARLALYLRPNLAIAQVLVGEILEAMERPEDAHAAYSAVDTTSPFDWTARLRAATSLADLDRTDEAIALLRAMIDERRDRSDAATTLGDTLRMKERYAEAVTAYDTAIQRTPEISERHWSLLYARGVALERTKQWDRAEADFLRALELQPDQPLVLNYLGYSWVEQRRNLDRAKGMIERAVSLRPNDGYIVDSLGWALYRLGEFEEAVGHLERAVELMSNDPVINDHLGDAYWQVGRRIEARFQWQRALALDPEPDVVDEIKRKLAKGLTAEAETDGAQ